MTTRGLQDEPGSDLITNLQAHPILYKEEPVITLRMMDDLHNRTPGTAGRNFREHRGKLLEGTDYHEVSREELPTNFVDNFDGGRPTSILLTESGYLLLVKCFRDPLAWEVQRKLVNAYFRAKVLERSEHVQDYSPIAKQIETGLKNALMPIVQPLVDGQKLIQQRQETVDKDVKELKDDVKDMRNQLAQVVRKKSLRAGTLRRHLNVIRDQFQGKCPCCRLVEIVDEYGNKLSACHEEHYFYPTENQVHRTWLTCGKCNQDLRTPSFHQNARTLFDGYQAWRVQYEQRKEPQLPFPED